MHVREKIDVVIGGLKTKFLKRGQGAPIIILHGILGRDAAPAAEAARDHEAFAPDLPGFWESEPPSEKLTVFWLGRWISNFHSQVIGTREVQAVGFSAGATFLVHYAATHPGAVRKLVLFEPIIKGREFPLWLRAFITVSEIPGAAALILKGAPHLLPILPGINQIGWRKRLRLVEGATSARSAGEIGRSLLAWDATTELLSLREIGTQILVVRGTKQSLVPYHTLVSLRENHISHLELSGLNHFLGREGQQQVVEVAREFLKPPRTF